MASLKLVTLEEEPPTAFAEGEGEKSFPHLKTVTITSMPLIFLTQTQTQLIKKNQYEYPFWIIRNSFDFVPSLK